MIQAPIFHVNGDDPEAVVRVARLAFEYRQAFNKDVVIDLVCYRRRGHNEGDDPSMTNPLMYQIIDAKRSVRKIYTEELIGRGDITVERGRGVAARLPGRSWSRSSRRPATRAAAPAPATPAARADEPEPEVETAVDAERGRGGSARRTSTCRRASPRTSGSQQLLERRAKMSVEGDIDWGFGEILAFGSLRRRGRHRAAVRPGLAARHVRAAARRRSWTPRPATTTCRCTSLAERRRGASSCTTRCCSEFAAMGFEYGYSVENPDALVLWEAQFGDFANGAQSIVDEFISSGEVKWGQRSSVTLLLPHGARGPGPGPHVRPARALPAAVRRGQHAGRDADHPGEPLPPAAPPGPVAEEEAAGRLHARSRCCGTGCACRRSPTSPPARFQPVLATGHRHARPGRGASGCCSAPARSSTTCSRPAPSGASPTPRSSGWSSSTRCRSRRCGRRWRSTRTPRTSPGCRRSRPTRAPGRSSRSTCWSTCDGRPAAPHLPAAAAAPAVGSTNHDAERRLSVDHGAPCSDRVQA